MWEFSVSGRVVASVARDGAVWTPSMFPMGSVASDGSVFVGGVLRGYAERDGNFWAPGMRYLGWARRNRWSEGDLSTGVSVFALGGRLVATCEDPSCPLPFASGIGVILWATKAVDWSLPVSWRENWNVEGAPRILFPAISFHPVGGFLSSDPDYLMLSRDLGQLIHSLAPSRTWRTTLDGPSPADQGEHLREWGTMRVWLRGTLENFHVDPDGSGVQAGPLDLLMASVEPTVLAAAIKARRGLKRRVISWLTRRLQQHARVDSFAPQVDCLPITTIPIEVDLGATDVSLGYSTGWITGWKRSITWANTFTAKEVDWLLATSCLEIDPDVVWWLRVRPASRAAVPVGDPLQLSVLRPDFIVVDSNDKAWVVVLSHAHDSGRVGVSATAQRWIRAAIWASCGREWGVLVLIPFPPKPLSWAALVSQFEVRP